MIFIEYVTKAGEKGRICFDYLGWYLKDAIKDIPKAFRDENIQVKDYKILEILESI